MTSNYQMWLTYNGGGSKLRFPVLPEKFTLKNGSSNTSVDIAGLGEIVVKQGRPAFEISFSSFFPKGFFTGVQSDSLTDPKELVKKIAKWKEGSKPVHLIITGTLVNMHCVISNLQVTENGGDVGTIHYTLTLKEYREVSVRKVAVNTTTMTATVAGAYTRTDNREQETTYTVVKGDCLWNIAKKKLGDGSRWKEIFELNTDVIKSGNLIYAGQVLKLPSS